MRSFYDSRAIWRAALGAAHSAARPAPLAVVLSLLALLTLALWAATPVAAAAVRPTVEGATVLSTTRVKVSFDVDVDASAAVVSNYSISPALLVTGAQLSDGGRTATLTTTPQLNAVVYTVTVSGVKAAGGGGQTMSSPQTGQFIGTPYGLNSTGVGHDDFNRPSGFRTTDAPIAGTWTTLHDNGGTIDLVSSPSLLGGDGDRALKSTVTSTDPDIDNAAVLHAIDGTEYYTSAYVYIPSGQGWEPDHAVGLLRLNETEYLAHARISAFTESPTAFTLKVNFKSASSTSYYGEQLVATGIAYDQWHWFQMRVKNSPASGQPGVVQVWIDGRLRYSQDTIPVARAAMTFAEVGIMHNVTIPTGPPSTTVTDAWRLGASYQLPSLSLDTTAPQGAITAPLAGQALRGTSPVTISATDDYDVQRVEFSLDGAPLATDDVPPFATSLDTTGLNEGPHSVSARVFDTSGNYTDAPAVPFTVDRTQATVSLDGVSPSPFTPDGDGDQDATVATYTTGEPTWQRVRVTTTGGTLVATPLDWTQTAAGTRQVTWDGRRSDGTPAAAGDYVVRVDVKDLVTPELAPATASATVTLLATLGAVTVAPTPFSPNGDGTRDELQVDYAVAGRSDVTVSVTTPDGEPVDTVQASTRRNPGSYTVTWDGSAGGAPAADGPYQVVVTAETAAGTDVKRRAVVLDTTAPVTGDDGDSAWRADDVTLQLTAGDALSAVTDTSVSVDGAPWQTATSATVAAPADGSNDGIHTVRYRSVDEAGNVETPREAQVRIDTTAPVTTVTGVDDLWHAGDVSLALEAVDAGSGAVTTEYRIDGGPWTPGTTAVVPGPPDGSNDGIHTVEYRSTDAAGRVEAPGQATVKIGHLDTVGRVVRHKRSQLVVVWPAVPGATTYEVLVDGQSAGLTDTLTLGYGVPADPSRVTLTVEVVARNADDEVLNVRGADVPWEW